VLRTQKAGHSALTSSSPVRKAERSKQKKKKDASTRCVLDLLDAHRTCEQLAAVTGSQRPAGHGHAGKKAAAGRFASIGFLTAASFFPGCMCS